MSTDYFFAMPAEVGDDFDYLVVAAKSLTAMVRAAVTVHGEDPEAKDEASFVAYIACALVLKAARLNGVDTTAALASLVSSAAVSSAVRGDMTPDHEPGCPHHAKQMFELLGAGAMAGINMKLALLKGEDSAPAKGPTLQ